MGVVLSALREVADQLKILLHGLAGFQCAQTACLNGRAISHGIGEGHAEFDHISTRLGQALHDS